MDAKKRRLQCLAVSSISYRKLAEVLAILEEGSESSGITEGRSIGKEVGKSGEICLRSKIDQDHFPRAARAQVR